MQQLTVVVFGMWYSNRFEKNQSEVPSHSKDPAPQDYMQEIISLKLLQKHKIKDNTHKNI